MGLFEKRVIQNAESDKNTLGTTLGGVKPLHNNNKVSKGEGAEGNSLSSLYIYNKYIYKREGGTILLHLQHDPSLSYSAWIAVNACLDCLPERLWADFVQFIKDKHGLMGIVDAIDEAARQFGIHTEGIEAK